MRLVDALTGKTIWANTEPTVHVHSQGLCADILAEHPGQECYAGEAKGGDQAWMYTAQGKRIGNENIGSLAPATLWWDADPQKEIILKGKLMKFPNETIFAPLGADRPQMVADLLGDWREELVTAVNGELRIYTTTIPATTRRPCLMQDRLYRLYVATNSMGYNTPPQALEPVRGECYACPEREEIRSNPFARQAILDGDGPGDRPRRFDRPVRRFRAPPTVLAGHAQRSGHLSCTT